MTRKTVTMSDIAKELGLSTVSVSKALSGKDGVGDAVREMIIKKAAEMGYTYTKGTKETVEKRHNIGIIVSEHFITKDAYYSRLYEKTMMKLTDAGQMGMLEIIMRKSEKILEPPALISSGRIEGIIILGQMSKKYLNMLRSYNLPILYMDFYDEDVTEDAVISDSVFGSSILTNYLIHKGHKKIGFVGSIGSTSSIMDRYVGYYRAMLSAGLPVKDEWRIEDRDEEGDFIEFELPKEMPTAFVCNSDAVAFNFVQKLQKMGYNVPDDVSVVAFDNFIYAEMSSPKITTYGVDTDALVRNVIKIMLEKLENAEYTAGRVLVMGSLIERSSVKAI